MFKGFSYKKKFLGVVIATILLLLAIYKKNLRHTFEARRELAAVEERLSTVDNSSNQIFILKNRINQIENIIGGQSDSPGQAQQDILDFISKTDYDVNIFSIEDTHVFNDTEFLIYSNTIEIEGPYNDLINLFYDIEKGLKESKIMSASIYSIMDYRTGNKNLYLKIVFQNYEKNI